MNHRLRWLSLFVLLCSFAAPGLAQGDGKLTLEAAFEPATAKPGDEVTLVLSATVDPQFHAYGSKETTNIPVRLDPAKLKPAGLEVVGKTKIPPGIRKEVFGVESFPLPHEFKVRQTMKVPAGMAAGTVTVKGELDYQVCDENMCLAPSAAAFSAKLVVEAAGPAPLGTKPGLKLVPDAKFTIAARFEPTTARAGDTVKLVLKCTVDPRYHAYGSKEPTNLPIALDPAKAKWGSLEAAGPAQIPPGDKKEVLGAASYPLPHEFEVVQALKVPAAQSPGDVVVDGKLDYQLCDENSCEMPAEAVFRATLKVEAAPVAAKEPEAEPAPLPDFGAKLTLEARFEPATARAGEPVKLVLKCTVDPRYHAYGSKETTNVPVALDPAKVQTDGLESAGAPQIPPGERKEVFGAESFPLPHEFEVVLPLKVPAGQQPGDVVVAGKLDYQLCDENSCDPPEEADFRATLKVEAGAARAAEPAKVAEPPKPDSPKADTPKSEPKNGPKQDDNPFGGSLWLLILACIGGGLFALAMPCTYPMIPITFSFFTKQAEKRGGKVLPLALTYGFGIVLMFTLVGALLSTVIVDVVNHWVTNAVIGVMFLFFAFVLFGWINLNPPQFIQRTTGKASSVGGYLGVFFMGATLVISSFTCTAPIVGSLLANVAQFGTGRVAFGMAIFGLTMAAPFVFLALMPTKVKSMPRSGEWMETLKISLGFVELAAALKFVSMVDFAMGWQALPRELFLMLWVAIFAMWALFLFGILRKAGTPNEGVSAGRMASGMFVTLLTAYFFFGALGYKLDFYTTNFIPGYSAESVMARGGGKSGDETGGNGHALGKHTVVLDDQPKAIQVAKADDKLLLYNFTGFN
jgi:thiol:disulfide interchange protein DsbD